MASCSPQGLQNLLGEVGVRGSIPEFASADVLNKPSDIYVSLLADILVQLTGCDRQVAYDSIATAADGWDLVAVLARLRLGGDPRELAQHVGDQVRSGCSSGDFCYKVPSSNMVFWGLVS